MQAICLKCKKTLPLVENYKTGEYVCECGKVISYKHGVYQFVQENEFYEGKFVKTHKVSTFFKKLELLILRFFSIDGNEERFWNKSSRHIKKHVENSSLQILNIGAGGGHDFLNKLGSVTAIDLSLISLINAQNIYDLCYQADAREMPFPDGSFDIVFSSHLLGHIPLEYKQQVIKEIHRVTKVGGFSLHSAECEADNIVYTRAKRYPTLYKKYFQDMFGHYGLEYPSICKKRFRDELFEPIYEISDYCKGLVRPANSYNVFFGTKEFKEKELIFKALSLMSFALSFNKYVSVLSGILLYPFTILNRLLGPDSVDSIKLLYRKKG